MAASRSRSDGVAESGALLRSDRYDPRYDRYDPSGNASRCTLGPEVVVVGLAHSRVAEVASFLTSKGFRADGWLLSESSADRSVLEDGAVGVVWWDGAVLDSRADQLFEGLPATVVVGESKLDVVTGAARLGAEYAVIWPQEIDVLVAILAAELLDGRSTSGLPMSSSRTICLATSSCRSAGATTLALGLGLVLARLCGSPTFVDLDLRYRELSQVLSALAGSEESVVCNASTSVRLLKIANETFAYLLEPRPRWALWKTDHDSAEGLGPFGSESSGSSQLHSSTQESISSGSARFSQRQERGSGASTVEEGWRLHDSDRSWEQLLGSGGSGTRIFDVPGWGIEVDESLSPGRIPMVPSQRVLDRFFLVVPLDYLGLKRAELVLHGLPFSKSDLVVAFRPGGDSTIGADRAASLLGVDVYFELPFDSGLASGLLSPDDYYRFLASGPFAAAVEEVAKWVADDPSTAAVQGRARP